MGTFVKFIESENFFPVLILLLVLLMFIFASILMSGKKSQRKRIQERKNIKIDESAQVQLVQEQEMLNDRKKEEEKIEIETGSTEVNLFLEETVESVDISEVEDNIQLNEENTTVEEAPIKEPAYKESEIINNVDLSDTEIEVAPFVIPNESISDQYTIPTAKTVVENITPEQIVNVELTKPTDKSNDIGEEVTIPHPTMSDESNEIPVIEEKRTNSSNDAFELKPDNNTNINEDIQVESPKEYTSDKTEILEFPDFDSLNQNVDAEDKIIKAANKYIESIMSR